MPMKTIKQSLTLRRALIIVPRPQAVIAAHTDCTDLYVVRSNRVQTITTGLEACMPSDQARWRPRRCRASHPLDNRWVVTTPNAPEVVGQEGSDLAGL